MKATDTTHLTTVPGVIVQKGGGSEFGKLSACLPMKCTLDGGSKRGVPVDSSPTFGDFLIWCDSFERRYRVR